MLGVSNAIENEEASTSKYNRGKYKNIIYYFGGILVMKKLLTFILVCIMVFSVTIPVMAATGTNGIISIDITADKEIVDGMIEIYTGESVLFTVDLTSLTQGNKPNTWLTVGDASSEQVFFNQEGNPITRTATIVYDSAGEFEFVASAVTGNGQGNRDAVEEIIKVIVKAPEVTVVGATASAYVVKLNGNKNDLHITVTEELSDGSFNTITEVFSINNNAIGTYNIGGYDVYVDTKGNVQVRECYIIG